MNAVANDRDRIRLGRLGPVDRNLNLLSELFELVDGGGTLQVGCDEAGIATFLAQEQCKLRGGRRLARPLQAGEQDDRRRPAREGESRCARAHQRRQLVVDDLHDLLAGRDALQHVLAERALAHLRHEVLDDLEIDVRLEQREPDLPHRTGDRLLVETSSLPEVAERALEPP